jgi:nucleoside-diphosphate-sugar epimerase
LEVREVRILIVGATGYIGSALVRALKGDHDLLGVARTEAAASKLREAGVEPVPGDITQPETLNAAARGPDAVVYAVQYHGSDGAQVEGAALRALADALRGTNKLFVFTSGAWIYGNTGERAASEDSPLDPTPLVAHRPQLEQIVREGRGVRAVVIRAADVYGDGGGLPAMWVHSAKETGAARYVGDGRNHWPMVHIDDLAQLYVSSLSTAPAGAIYNAADETSLTVAQMAEAASEGAGRNGATVSWPLDEARRKLGAFAYALALDQRIDSKRAREELGWRTRSTTALDDLRNGSYVLS